MKSNGLVQQQNTGLHHYKKSAHYKNKNWLQFLFIVKAAFLKQQISKLYPQIQRTAASDHINFSQRQWRIQRGGMPPSPCPVG